MAHWLDRTELLIGNVGVEKLRSNNILVVGLGGIGSYAAEAMVRAGIGNITIIDGDDVDPTNKNRQLHSMDSTIGQKKTKLMAERLMDINPELNLTSIEKFIEPDEMIKLIEIEKYDFIMDCIDSVQTKLNLIIIARRLKYKFISAMGAGGKMDPSKIKIADISKTKDCKFAQQVRKELKKIGIENRVLTVYSDEIQKNSSLALTDGSRYKKSYYGTISYIPAMFGLTMAGEVIRRLLR